MSPHSKHQRDRVFTGQEWSRCVRKAKYSDRGVAMKHGRRSMAERNAGQLWVYRCKACKGWHLTRMPGRDADKVC